MATLHMLSHSPFADNRLASCLRLLGEQDAIVLTGDAVYALQPATDSCQALLLMPASVGLYALDEDLQARAIEAPERVTPLDYPAFVEICTRYSKVNSWL
ncbi:tRNA 2-thiouridine synthesizing protein B [Pseudomonas sp. 8Z]|uniref:sulfurtransferase complex subunit TusB n=1 Tax=Pseudomonas sp. 8Z TaxID=2653166 RepID=UPI0012F0F512|nr:sulfurtransferase complex subunit TusB [Pseudomonas sp. 8Z]VXD00853.1 tRNA 2-thiouridine synthesizing protein B [Pseudomonas sp. 8Z]